MNNQIKISKFDALNKQDLENTSGGLLLVFPVIVIGVTVLYGIALYGAFMDGYNSGKAAAGR